MSKSTVEMNKTDPRGSTIKKEGDIWVSSQEYLILLYRNNKGADQTAHPCSLISTFVIHFL